MGNILNIINSKNDFKKTDGLLPLECGPFFNFEFQNNINEIVKEYGTIDILMVFPFP